MSKKNKAQGYTRRVLPASRVFTPKPAALRDALLRALVRSIWPEVAEGLTKGGVLLSPRYESAIKIAISATAATAWELCESIHATDAAHPGAATDAKLMDEIVDSLNKVTVQ